LSPSLIREALVGDLAARAGEQRGVGLVADHVVRRFPGADPIGGRHVGHVGRVELQPAQVRTDRREQVLRKGLLQRRGRLRRLGAHGGDQLLLVRPEPGRVADEARGGRRRLRLLFLGLAVRGGAAAARGQGRHHRGGDRRERP
jgi:hypothetical protein